MQWKKAALVMFFLLALPTTVEACNPSDCCCSSMSGYGGYACRDKTLCEEAVGNGKCYPDSNCEGKSSKPQSEQKVTMRPIPKDAVDSIASRLNRLNGRAKTKSSPTE